MTILEAIILGLIQGISEFLPISSSGHLVIAEHLLGVTTASLTFDVGLHIATLVAVVIALWGEIKLTTKDFFTNFKSSLGFKIILATIPVGIFGVLFEDKIVEYTRSIWVVALSLMLWGAILIFADYLADRIAKKTVLAKTNWGQVMAMGFAQVLSLIPGTSRSGITITAGLFAKMDRKAAAKISFLLSLPAIAGAGLIGLKDVFEFGLDVPASSLVVGMLVACVSGVFCIRWLLSLLTKYGFKWFGIYRIALGFILLLWFL